MQEAQQPRQALEPNLQMSRHAARRMQQRNISEAAVRTALEQGRVVHVRGAAIHAIGRKEISRLRRHGIDLSGYDGVQVVCAPDGTILTAYRNRDFRSLRPCCRRAARPAR